MTTHSKTRADKRAAGLKKLSAWIDPEELEAIRAEAARLNMSESGDTGHVRTSTGRRVYAQ